MKKVYGLIIGGILFVVFIAGAGILYNNLAADYDSGQNFDMTKESDKIMAADFKVEDEEGNSVNLLSFTGKPIVLNFWASWCGPCKNELPDFQAAYEKYEGKVEFIMVNMTDGVRETKEIASSYMKEQGYTLPVYYDTAQEAAYTYGVYSLPTTYFIAEDGEVMAGAQGMIDADTLETGISMIYKTE